MGERVERFEDLIAWQRARELAKEVYAFCRGPGVRRDFALVNQLTRAAGSTMSNIAEGYERDGNRELLQFLSHAKGSCGEVRAQLHLALDCGYVVESRHREMTQRCEDVSRMLAGWMRQIKASGFEGRKFR